MKSLIADASSSPCPAGFESLCFNFESKPDIVSNVLTILTIIAIILSVIFLILGGIRWIMSGGDKGKVEQARSVVIAAIVGLVVSFLAYHIISMVIYLLTGRVDINNFTIPRLID